MTPPTGQGGEPVTGGGLATQGSGDGAPGAVCAPIPGTAQGERTTESAEAVRPLGAHGSIGLDAAACTSCNLCVTECPTWCITLTARTEDAPVAGPAEGTSAGARAPRGRARKVKVLESFEIDYGLCMYCGICVEVCPFDALAWSPQPVAPRESAADLREGIADLGDRWPR